MTLETARLILRPWEDADAESLYKYASDPEIGSRAGWPPHTSVENSLEIIRDPQALGGPETCAMVLRETGEAIGSVGLFPPEDVCRLAGLPADALQLELGYWVARPYWGRGLVPEAGREMLRHAFEDLGCAVVHCSHFDFNAQSRRVIGKLGFTYHMTADSPLSRSGESCPTLYYLLTREDWEKDR